MDKVTVKRKVVEFTVLGIVGFLVSGVLVALLLHGKSEAQPAPKVLVEVKECRS